MKDIIIGPNSFIRPPYTDCPKCKAQYHYGILSIYEGQYMRRCKSCMHKEIYWLPKCEKKIIYIDQFVISSMMKSLDPEWNLKGTRHLDSFWIRMFGNTRRITRTQGHTRTQGTVHLCPRFKETQGDGSLEYNYHWQLR